VAESSTSEDDGTMKKPGFTLDRHQQLGVELAIVHDYLVKRSVEIKKAYPKNSRAATQLTKAHEAVAQARSALDELLFAEHPEMREAGTKVYYPSAEARDAADVVLRDAWSKLGES
jgi:hypothetical protein